MRRLALALPLPSALTRPLQFYSLVDFVCPTLLGDAAAFRRVFRAPSAPPSPSDPIPIPFSLPQFPSPHFYIPHAHSPPPSVDASRDRSAAPAARRLGAERLSQLRTLTSSVLLRRDASVNEAYLPPRTDYAVFVAPSTLQAALYASFLKLPHVRSMLTGGGGAAAMQTLAAILALRRLCNGPGFLLAPAASPQSSSSAAASAAIAASAAAAADDDADGAACVSDELLAPLLRCVPAGCDASARAHSSKLRVLEGLLSGAEAAGDRTVVVSGSSAWRAFRKFVFFSPKTSNSPLPPLFPSFPSGYAGRRRGAVRRPPPRVRAAGRQDAGGGPRRPRNPIQRLFLWPVLHPRVSALHTSRRSGAQPGWRQQARVVR